VLSLPPPVLQSIGLLLSEPNPDDGLMGDIAAEFKHRRDLFDAKARSLTREKASGTAAGPDGGVAQAEAPPAAAAAVTAATAEPAEVPRLLERPANGPAAEELAPPRKRLQLAKRPAD